MDLKIFGNNDFGNIRVLEKDGELWFVAKDMIRALGYESSSKMGMLLKHVPKEWKGVNLISTPGGNQEMATLSEQGLYFFLARSDKPKALPFQKWLAGEVLPTIRKYGAYLSQQKVKEILTDPDTIIQLAMTIKEERNLRIAAEEERDIAVGRLAQYEKQIKNDSDYMPVRGISWLQDYFEDVNAMYQQVGRQLSTLSRMMGYPIHRNSYCAHPSGRRSYHLDVISKLKDEIASNDVLLAQFRRKYGCGGIQ